MKYSDSIKVDDTTIAVNDTWIATDGNTAVIKSLHTHADSTVWIEYENKDGVVGEKTYKAFSATFDKKQ